MSDYRTNNTFKGRKLNRFNALYKAKISSASQIQPEEGEVSETRWFTLDEIKKLIAEQPESVTHGLVQVMTDY